jgi:DNA-binding CsgD family transcriptional regulator
VFDLTPRQIVLLQHFSQGLSLAQIAKQTNLKPQTVREAFSNLYAKFEVRGQLELMSVLAAITYVAVPQGSV